MTWACMASSGTGLLVFIDDVTEDRTSWMNSEVYRDILSAQIQSNGPWVPDLRQSLPAKDSQQNIKNEHFIYDYIYLSNYIWAPENWGGGGGLCIKMVVIPKHVMLYFCSNPLNPKLKVCISITSWLFYFKSTVVVYKGKSTKTQSVSEYFRFWLYFKM